MKELEAWAYQYVGNTAAEDELWDIVSRMVAAEREACAKLARTTFIAARDTDFDIGAEVAREVIAAAIRAGGHT